MVILSLIRSRLVGSLATKVVSRCLTGAMVKGQLLDRVQILIIMDVFICIFAVRLLKAYHFRSIKCNGNENKAHSH